MDFWTTAFRSSAKESFLFSVYQYALPLLCPLSSIHSGHIVSNAFNTSGNAFLSFLVPITRLASA